jgi:2,3-dihydroxy-p-cumate/2,3-dihydroxybenzoate 3,4-dioxygenase
MTRYNRLAYVALNATDPERTACFYEDEVGLERAGTTEAGAIKLRCSSNAYDLLISAAPDAGLKRVAFEMSSPGDLIRLRERLNASSTEVHEVDAKECTDLGVQSAFRISEPVTGAIVEFHAAANASSDSAPEFKPTLAKIQRLGHVVIKSPRLNETIAFFRDLLGFSISDIIEESACFMRCTPNPFHHTLAVGAGPAGLHHVNFMVTEIDDVGRAIHRFRRDDVAVVAGPGRHPTSGSVFLYFLDPDGLTVEYSFGMEEFPEVNPRAHRVLPAVPESADTWGAPRDRRHGAIGAIERMPADG